MSKNKIIFLQSDSPAPESPAQEVVAEPAPVSTETTQPAVPVQ